MPKPSAIPFLASVLLSCTQAPPISGVGSFQFAATGADLGGGTATIHVTVTAEFGFAAPVVVTLSDPPAGLTADPLTVPAGGSRGDLVLHGQTGLVLDRFVTVTGTAGTLVQSAPAWVTSGFDTGSLDPGFGDGGVAIVPAPAGCGGLALESDGGLVVGVYGGPGAPGTALRLTGGGRLDPDFGLGGVAALAGHAGGPRQIIVDDDGAILVVGDETSGGPTHGRLWKLDGHGAPDATFGTGGFAEPIALGSYRLSLAGGKRYLLGSTGGTSGYMARVAADGSLDPQLGTAGVLHVPFVGGAAALADGSGWLVAGTSGTLGDATLRGRLAILSVDGVEMPDVDDPGDAVSGYTAPLATAGALYAVLVEYSYAADGQKSFVQRLRPDLTPDPSFVADVDGDSAIQLVAAQAGGKLVVVKSPGSQVLEHVVRLDPDGSADPAVRIAIGKLLHGRVPDDARLTCGPALDAEGRLVLGYESTGASGTLSLVRVEL